MSVTRTAQHRAHAQEQPFLERPHVDTFKPNPWDLRAGPLSSPQAPAHAPCSACLCPWASATESARLGATSPFRQRRAARRQTLFRQIRRRYGTGWGLWPACECHDSASSKPSGLRRMWRWELSYGRITALFDLRGRKDAVTGWERRYRERRATRMRDGRANGHSKPRGSKPANGKHSHAARSGPSNMFILPPCK